MEDEIILILRLGLEIVILEDFFYAGFDGGRGRTFDDDGRQAL